MALGSRLQGNFDLRERAVEVLTKLAKATGETAHLVMPMETYCYLQEVVDSPQLVRVASRPGTLIDYHCSATGKCLLAFNSERLVNLRNTLELSFHTVSTITDWSSLEVNLAEVRKRGYAIDDEEYHDGVRCVAAPVCNAAGAAVAAIGVTGTITSLTKPRIASVAESVMEAAGELAFAV
jgi:IclR family acetate operon transcriptional repressor